MFKTFGRCIGRKAAGADGQPHRVSAETRFVQCVGGGILLCLRTGRLFRLNRTAADIWKGLAQEKPVTDIAGGAGPEEAAETIQGVDCFIRTLADLGLVSAGRGR